MAELIVEDRSGVRRVPIGSQMTIGRSDRNDLVVNAMFTSRRHAWVWRQGDRVIVEDLGSSNGTYVNGRRLTAAQFLRHNDLITMGDTQFWYVDRWDPSGDRTPPGGSPQVRQQPVFCSRCAMPNQPGSEFCRRCGTPLAQQATGPDVERTQPGRSLTPTDPVVARPFPASGSLPSRRSRQGTRMLIVLLVIVTVLLLAILGLLAVYTLS